MNQRPGGDGLARQETGIGRIDPPCLENQMRRQQQCLTFKRESWKSIKPIPTFPPPRRPRAIYEIIPKRSRPKLPASNSPFRLIPGLEKTDPDSMFIGMLAPATEPIPG